MFTSAACIYSVNKQARSICAQTAVKDKHKFIVGTCSNREANEISILQYDEDDNQIDLVALYSHPDQVWVVEPSHQDHKLIATSAQSKAGARSVGLWKLDGHETSLDDYDGSDLSPQELTDAGTLNAKGSGFVHSVKWHAYKNNVMTSDGSVVNIWSVGETPKVIGSLVVDTKAACPVSDWCPGAVAWDPHNQSICAIGSFSKLCIADTRKMEITQQIPDAHQGGIRDVDYNPNKPLTLITAGDDRKIKVWDLRSCRSPIKCLSSHSHWVWTAKYNPFHDQLIASGGTDNMVNLWRVASCSSAPWFDEGVATDSLAPSPAANAKKGRTESDSSQDSGFGDGIEGSGHNSDNNDDAGPYSKSHLLAGDGGGGSDKLASDPPDIKVKAIDQHEDSVYGLAWSACDAWMFCSLSYEGRVILNHVPSTEKYKILL
jgi:WD40 repeat protein